MGVGRPAAQTLLWALVGDHTEPQFPLYKMGEITLPHRAHRVRWETDRPSSLAPLQWEPPAGQL